MPKVLNVCPNDTDVFLQFHLEKIDIIVSEYEKAAVNFKQYHSISKKV